MSMTPDDRLADLNERIARLERTVEPDIGKADGAPEPTERAEPKAACREQRIRRLTLRLIVGAAFLAYVLWAALNWREAQPTMPMAMLFFLSAGSIVTFGFNVLHLDLSWNASPWSRERKPPSE